MFAWCTVQRLFPLSEVRNSSKDKTRLQQHFREDKNRQHPGNNILSNCHGNGQTCRRKKESEFNLDAASLTSTYCPVAPVVVYRCSPFISQLHKKNNKQYAGKKKKTFTRSSLIARHRDLSNRCQCSSVLEQSVLLLSHNILVNVSLAMVRCYEGVQPADGEGVSEHHLHIHPFWLLGPSSLLLLKLLDALWGPYERNEAEMSDSYQENKKGHDKLWVTPRLCTQNTKLEGVRSEYYTVISVGIWPQAL